VKRLLKLQINSILLTQGCLISRRLINGEQNTHTSFLSCQKEDSLELKTLISFLIFLLDGGVEELQDLQRNLGLMSMEKYLKFLQKIGPLYNTKRALLLECL